MIDGLFLYYFIAFVFAIYSFAFMVFHYSYQDTCIAELSTHLLNLKAVTLNI